MSEVVEKDRTVGDVLGKFDVAVQGFNSKSLDELSHEDFGVIISAVIDLQVEVERVHDALTDEWAARYEMHPDGSVTRREA
jgi:cyanate lyase